ncbi:hypothetical protein S83_022425 [Arachis hypogaea]
MKDDLISDELLKAMEASMFAIIVLSPNYASSTWCLDELCKIHIVADFYGVRHQKGTIEESQKVLLILVGTPKIRN